MNDLTYTESDLNTNLNELVHEMVRELYIAAKKVSIYSVSHPISQKAIGRPFMLMEKVFRFKKYINLHISSGHLYALNIRTRPSIFTEQIMDYMHVLDIHDILFMRGMTANHLSVFLDRFVKRLRTGDYRNLMSTHLETNRIDTILINEELGNELFECGHRFQADVIRDFSVRGIIGSLLDPDFEQLATLISQQDEPQEEYIARYHHDYYPQLVAFLVPEKIGMIASDEVITLIVDRLSSSGSSSSESCRQLITGLNYHPRCDEILRRLDEIALEGSIDREAFTAAMPVTSKIRIASAEQIDQYLDETFNTDPSFQHLGDFQDHFGRLLRTGQQGKAQVVVNLVLEHLAGPNLDFRQRALVLLKEAINTYQTIGSITLLDQLNAGICDYIRDGRETFEFSDLIWDMAKACIADRQYEILASLCTVLSSKRQQMDGIWSYESVAVKKAIEELDRREVIARLVGELIDGNPAHSQYLKDIMTAIGSEEMAVALSGIISHESRNVRQQVLKILSGLGKASLTVFNRFMIDNSNFEREENRRELPDEKWYQVRNAIFVLGALQDPEACRSLRHRLSDPDTRIRRAIVSALEKIGGEEATDLLLVMADDSDGEIRESAIIALGLVGTPEIVPELIALTGKQRGEIIRIITALGKLGGENARTFLSRLLNDPHLQSELTSSRSSREELKLATLKALGRIGDSKSIQTIKEFAQSNSGAQKLFFSGSKLNKVAEDILGRQG
ncbi:MAG: HEAT repeat domain-containing protein [Candidatus Zixiibacteriota bacterium]|nr:MAG: HEAT repeat domain-containing protein [candidate division Zixibacteria bacterium]